MTQPDTDSNRVYITNREIYDMAVGLQNKVNALNNKLAALMVTNTLVTGVLAYLLIEGLK